jgi:hypothetical protein
MKAVSVHELKKALSTLVPPEMLEVVLRLAKFKKENKELITYLLYEAQDEEAYIKSIKAEIDLQFSEMNTSNMHLVKKSVRKILRMVNKFSRYSGLKQTETELRIYFCQSLKSSGIPVKKSQVMINLYENQLKKIGMLLEGLHEDIQYDYSESVEALPLA